MITITTRTIFLNQKEIETILKNKIIQEPVSGTISLEWGGLEQSEPDDQPLTIKFEYTVHHNQTDIK